MIAILVLRPADLQLLAIFDVIHPKTTCWKSWKIDTDGARHRDQQVPVEHWHLLIGDPIYADAILDRLVHNATRIDLTGESLRRNEPSPASGLTKSGEEEQREIRAQRLRTGRHHPETLF